MEATVKLVVAMVQAPPGEPKRPENPIPIPPTVPLAVMGLPVTKSPVAKSEIVVFAPPEDGLKVTFQLPVWA
jgi:hypothetical protein